MFKKLLPLILALSMLVGCASAQPDAVKKAHSATHEIYMATIVENAGCSATAVSHHALLTATHCELGTDSIVIDGGDPDKQVHILSRIRDGNDHTIFVTDDYFENYAEILDRDLEQGDTVFAFGNPGPLQDILRYGTFSGEVKPSFFGPPASRLLFDFNVYHGDSGAALFDAVTGKIAAVITGYVSIGQGNDSMKLTYAWPLAFTNAQLQQIR